MSCPPELGVKQFVACVQNSHGGQFVVFTTGSDRHYLFSQVIPDTTIASGLMFPVLKKDLRDDIRRALSHGWGNCNLGRTPKRAMDSPKSEPEPAVRAALRRFLDAHQAEMDARVTTERDMGKPCRCGPCVEARAALDLPEPKRPRRPKKGDDAGNVPPPAPGKPEPMPLFDGAAP